MSTAAVSSSSLNQLIQQYFHTRQTDLHQLGKALGTGDLAGAKAAFQEIAKLGQGGPFASGDPFSNSQREQDFTAIGKALQAGDLAGAQKAFSDLKATFEKGSGLTPPTPANSPSTTPPSSVGPEIVINLSNSSGSTNPEQITINLNPTSGGGEQVSLSIGEQGSAQQVTLNLAPNSNEEIVLNLLGASSPTGNSSSSSAANGSSTNGSLSVSA